MGEDRTFTFRDESGTVLFDGFIANNELGEITDDSDGNLGDSLFVEVDGTTYKK